MHGGRVVVCFVRKILEYLRPCELLPESLWALPGGWLVKELLTYCTADVVALYCRATVLCTLH